MTEAVTATGGVLVVVELRRGALTSTTYELLAAAVQLRDTVPGPVTALLLGSGVVHVAKALIARGADRVLLAESAALAEYEPEAYAAVVEEVAQRLKPAVTLFQQSLLGRDLAPRVAFQLETALSPDCVELRTTGGGLTMVRPVYGGKFLAVQRLRQPVPAVLTLRAKSFTPLAPDPNREGEVIRLDTAAVALRARVVGRTLRAQEGIPLEDAEVVISGGRGLGGPEAFQDLHRLAALMGGAVGASRAAVDAGWIDYSHQVGLTGKTVKPRLYIAIGISGATQHLAGCSGATAVIAINNDAHAPIFQWAHYGIVADWRKALPALTTRVAELLQ